MGMESFFIFLCALPVVAARQYASVHDTSLSVALPALPAFMQKSEPCACSFKGKCSCEGALEFMACTKDKCSSGDCNCVVDGTNHFQKSCKHMQSACPDIGLQCESDESMCDGDIVAWSQDLPSQDEEQAGALKEAGSGEDVDEQLPSGWEKAWSEEEQRYYYVNRETGETTYDKPGEDNSESLNDEKEKGRETSDDEQDDMLPGWEAVWSKEEGRYYYHNGETGVSTWVKPKASAATTAAPQDDSALEDSDPKYIKKRGKRYVSHDHYKQKVGELHSHEHHVFARGVIAIIVVMSLTVALASTSNQVIETNTWSTLDMVFVTFLAMAWFYVTMHFLEFHKFSGWPKVFMHCGMAVLLLLVSSLVSWQMKIRGGGAKGHEAMLIFQAIASNILLWSFAGFVSTTQQMFKHSAVLVLIATVVLAVFYALLSLFWYYIVGRITKQPACDGDVINMLAGAALAAGTVLWVHMVIAGGYHTVEDPRPTKPSFMETLFMNGFSFIYMAVALALGPRITKISDSLKVGTPPARNEMRTYWKKRIVDSLGVFVSFLPYYSCVLSLGHLIIDHMGYDPGQIEARLYLAVISTFIGMFLIVMCAKVSLIAEEKTLSSTLIGLGGFMTGTAWGNLLNNSINMMAHGYTHPFKLKLMVTCFLTAIVFPVYFYFFKPLVNAKMDSKAASG